MKTKRDSQSDKPGTDERSEEKLIEAQDKLEAIEGIKRGLESMRRNGGKHAEDFFREFFAEKGIRERK